MNLLAGTRIVAVFLMLFLTAIFVNYSFVHAQISTGNHCVAANDAHALCIDLGTSVVHFAETIGASLLGQAVALFLLAAAVFFLWHATVRAISDFRTQASLLYLHFFIVPFRHRLQEAFASGILNPRLYH